MHRPTSAAATHSARTRAGASLLAILLAWGSAAAQEPTFTFTKPERAEKPIWKATAQLGVTANTGNNDALGATLSARASRRTGRTRVSAEARGAYARSQLRIAAESDGVPGIGRSEIQTVTQTATEAWELKLRTDRYFGERNSFYVAAGAGGDRPAGKRLVGAGQVGYARALVLSSVHEVTLELGYDLSHEDYVTSTAATTSHSARAFLGWQETPWPVLALRASVDVLENLAPEQGPTGDVPSFGHARVLGRAEADVKVNSKGALGLRFRARYDSAPAPLPSFGGQAFEAGYAPLADRLDTTTELVFVYTLF